MGLCPKSGLATFASDGLPGFQESYSLNVLKDCLDASKISVALVRFVQLYVFVLLLHFFKKEMN